MATQDDIKKIEWPDEFVVIYSDGSSERLLRGSGVHYQTAEDNPDGLGGFSALVPKHHPKSPHQHARFVAYCQLRSLEDIHGKLLWPFTAD